MTAWVPVTSTSLRAVRYDAGRHVLDVEFTGGARYRYEGVSPDLYAGLLQADSLGRYFNHEIRGSHPYEEID